MSAATSTNKLDDKNVEVAKLLYRLRQDIDLYWVIGRNVAELKDSGVGASFWGHVQSLALDSLVLTICKIFEREDQYERNSIPAVLKLIPEMATSEQWLQIRKFGNEYKYTGNDDRPDDFLQAVVRLFREQHKDSLARLVRYRNKFGAHSEHGTEIESLPSIAEFDAFFIFADSFYRLVQDQLNGIGPALISSHVHLSTLRVMEKLGAKNLDRSPSREGYSD